MCMNCCAVQTARKSRVPRGHVMARNMAFDRVERHHCTLAHILLLIITFTVGCIAEHVRMWLHNVCHAYVLCAYRVRYIVTCAAPRFRIAILCVLCTHCSCASQSSMHTERETEQKTHLHKCMHAAARIHMMNMYAFNMYTYSCAWSFRASCKTREYHIAAQKSHRS